jgi:hypothetical protein
MIENEETKAGEQPPKETCDCFCMGVGPRVTDAVRVKSTKTREHFRNARVEFLKGLRTILDERIDRLSRHGRQKGTTVPVE